MPRLCVSHYKESFVRRMCLFMHTSASLSCGNIVGLEQREVENVCNKLNILLHDLSSRIYYCCLQLTAVFIKKSKVKKRNKKKTKQNDHISLDFFSKKPDVNEVNKNHLGQPPRCICIAPWWCDACTCPCQRGVIEVHRLPLPLPCPCEGVFWGR